MKDFITSILNLPLVMKVVLLSSAACGFVCDHILNITMTYNEQFLSVGFVVLLDGFFGVIAGTKREGFKTYKALKVIKTMCIWWIILFVILSLDIYLLFIFKKNTPNAKSTLNNTISIIMFIYIKKHTIM